MLVRYEDPNEITERVAVAGFLAGYTGGTRASYATDLRLFTHWCTTGGVRLLDVKRAHLELFARQMETDGRMSSTVARRLSTLASFYRYCHLEAVIDRTRPPTCADRKSTTNHAPSGWIATISARSWSKPVSVPPETTR